MRGQLAAADGTARKELAIRRAEAVAASIAVEVADARARLLELHQNLSRIERENSQTEAYFDKTKHLNVEVFRSRYQEHCKLLERAYAIAELYHPALSDGIRRILGEMGNFWGDHEQVLSDMQRGGLSKATELNKLAMEAALRIASEVSAVQKGIADEGNVLSKLRSPDQIASRWILEGAQANTR